MTGSLQAVLAAVGAGGSVADVAARTGLDRDAVHLAVSILVRRGLVGAEALASGCPTGGCGTCPSGRGGSPGCGRNAPDPGTGSGTRNNHGDPVPLVLSVRRPAGH